MKRVLIIEDQPNDINFLKKSFNGNNIIYDIAKDGLEAFYCVSRFFYSAIIISNEMQDLDSIWIAKYLLNNTDSKIILAARNPQKKIFTDLEKLNVRYLRKPSRNQINKAIKFSEENMKSNRSP